MGSPEDAVLPDGASLALVISQDASALQWHYDPDVLSGENIHRMKEQFNLFLSACLSEPNRPMWELPLLTPEEYHRILVEWNANETDYPGDKGIHQLFEAQVARAPNRTAVVHNSKELSYNELNRRANQLAHYLMDLGVKTDIPVGLFVVRSFDMAIGVLGILKAGGAYLPLDPGYPQERLAFMIHDSKTPVIVTQKRIAESLPEHEAKTVSHRLGLGSHHEKRREKSLRPVVYHKSGLCDVHIRFNRTAQRGACPPRRRC